MPTKTRPPTNADRVAAARLVAGRGSRAQALLISVHNTGLGWIDLADAVSTGLAYAVAPHPSLLCVDLDLDSQNAGRAAAAFDRVVDAADAAGVPYVVCGSGRTGHRHLFCVTGELDSATRDALDDHLRRGGLDVRRTAIRPPHAPHRSGVLWSQPDRPVDVLDQKPDPERTAAFLEELGALAAPAPPHQQPVPPRPVSGQLTLEELTGALSARTVTLLRFGHRRFKYRSASEARMAVAAEVLRRGGDDTHLEALFADPRNLLGVSYRRRSRRWRAQECARLIAKVASGHLTDERVVAWCAAVNASQWKGRAGHTDLAVAELFATRAQRANTATVSLAVAEAAAEVGVRRGTARRSLRRLRDAGWIRVTEAPTSTFATLYELTVPDAANTSAGAANVPSVDLGCDAARGLGRAAVRVWRLLDGPRTAAEVATTLGVGAATVHAHIRRLRRFGCVRRIGRRWVACGNLEVAACRAGTAGSRAAAREALAAERRSRRDALPQIRAVAALRSTSRRPSRAGPPHPQG